MNRKSVNLLWTLLLFILFPAWAAADRWVPFGPGGGTVIDLALDTANPERVYAATTGGLFASGDGGATWAWIADTGGCCIASVAVDPADSRRLLAGGMGMLLLSTDRGRSWTRVLEGGDFVFYKLAFAPGTPSVGFAIDRGWLLRSPDGGRTWGRVDLPWNSVRDLAVDPKDPRRVYAMDHAGLRVSLDRGLTWAALGPAASPQNGEGRAMAVAPSRPSTLYLALDHGFFRSDNQGRTWRRLRTPVGEDARLYRLVVPRGETATVYAATSKGVRVSRDGGSTWAAANRGLPLDSRGFLEVRALAADPSRPEIVYGGLANFDRSLDWGVAKTWNGGRGWSLGLQRGLSALRFGFVKSPAPGVYFAAANPDGAPDGYLRLWASRDGGQRWEVSGTFDGEGVTDMAFDPAAPDILYVSTRTRIWKSRDGGHGWSRLAAPRTAHLALAGDDTLLAAGPCGLHRSADGGLTWTEILPCGVQVLRLAVDPGNPSRVWADVVDPEAPSSSYRQIYGSVDMGVTWRYLDEGELVTVAPSRPETLYAQHVGDFGIDFLRSDDHGATWSVAGPLTGPFVDLIVDPRSPETLYGATTNRGVLRSRDGGVTWEPVNVGLSRKRRLEVPVVVADPWEPGRLFALPWSGGGLFTARFPIP